MKFIQSLSLLLCVLCTLPSIAQKKARLKLFQCHCRNDTNGRYTDKCTNCKADNVLLYDAKCKSFSQFKNGEERPIKSIEDFHLCSRESFQIKIINLNRYLYNVDLKNSDIHFSSSEPRLMQEYLFPRNGDSAASFYNSYVNGNSNNGNANIYDVMQDFQVIMDKAYNTVFNLDQLKLMKSKRDTLLKEQTTINNKLQNERNETKKSELTNTLINITNKLRIVNEIIFETIPTNYNSKQSYDTVADEIINDYSDTYDIKKLFAYSRSIRKCITDLEDLYNNLIENKIIAYNVCTENIKCCSVYNLNYSYFDKKIRSLKNNFLWYRVYYTNVDTLVKGLLSSSSVNPIPTVTPKKTDTFTVTGSDIIIENNRIKGITLHQAQDTSKPKTAEKPKTRNPLDDIDSLWAPLQKIAQAQIMRMIQFNNNMVNQNMSYTSPPIFPYGDRMGLTLKIGPTDSLAKLGILPTNVDEISLDFPIYGKSSFSFSTGTFIGLHKFVQSKSYDWQQQPIGDTITSSSPYRLAQSDGGSAPIGFCALANVSTKVCPSFNIGLSGGVGATLETKPRIAYLLGGSLSFGTYQKFHLTGGITYMQVNVISESQNNTTVYYNSKPADIQYNRVIKPGYFLSVSYTVFTIKNTSKPQ